MTRGDWAIRLALVLAVVAILAMVVLVKTANGADQVHRARCHGVERPRLGLGIPGGPWACRPGVGWYWPVPDIYGIRVTYGTMGQR